MTLACMLQQMQDETDRNMELLTQVNVEVKYALGMALDEPGIDHTNFHVHRQRLIQKDLDKVYLDRFIRLLYYLGVLTGKEPFLTDTTHSVAPISAPTTIELIRQAMRILVRLISKSFPKKWKELSTRLSASRYLEQFNEKKEHMLDEDQKQQRLAEVVKEADELLAFLQQEEGPWKKDQGVVSRALILCRILHERVTRLPDGSVQPASLKNIKDILVSAEDIEARFGNKGKTKWRGYKIATVEVGNTGFIAAADTLKANEYDGKNARTKDKAGCTGIGKSKCFKIVRRRLQYR